MMINKPNQLETNLNKTGDNLSDLPEISEEQNNLDSNQQLEGKAQDSFEVSESMFEVTQEQSQPPGAVETEEKESQTSETELPQFLPDPAEVIETLQQQISDLLTQLDKQREENNSLKAQSVRIAADFENFRRRTLKEKQELEQQVKKKTINELLTVVDNFERARMQIKPANDGEMGIHKSYQGVYKSLVDSLKKIGVSAMRPEGKPFDPAYHEAMFREPTNAHPEGTVIEELVRGYLLNEEVLRHAMVKVAAPIEGEGEQGLEAVNNQQSPPEE